MIITLQLLVQEQQKEKLQEWPSKQSSTQKQMG